MGSIHHAPRHQQICWSTTVDEKQPTSMISAKDEDKIRDRKAYQNVYQSTLIPGFDPGEETVSAHPILSDKAFIARLQRFHEALVRAVANIVERWWEDDASDFPSKMPLEPPVEDVLQWIDRQAKRRSMPALSDCLGSWRPDFLLTDNEISAPGSGFQVCEINSRSPINALIHNANKHDMMRKLLGPNLALQPAGESDALVHSLLDLFDHNLPIHLVRGRDNLERQEFNLLAERVTGSIPRLVSVSDLELLPDSSSATGYALYCNCQGRAEGEKMLERVHQVALLLFPDEFSHLSQNMLRHLARASVNDFRTALLVNDQRFLGIILQEIANLVDKHKVLTPEQAQILRKGIVPTILPGSQELKALWVDCRNQGEAIKNDFILKASRESRGKGHLLGDELSTVEWEAALLDMQDPSIRARTTSYVLQRYIPQPKFDIVVDESKTVCDSQIVGTYYSVGGRFLGLGPWRSGNAKICNVHGGGCVIVNAVTTANDYRDKLQKHD